MGTPAVQSVALTVAACSGGNRVKHVAVTLNAGLLQLVKNAAGDLNSYGAPHGFRIQAVRAPTGQANFSSVPDSCRFSLGAAAADAQQLFAFRTCGPCFKCLQALGFKCGERGTSLYVRVSAAAKSTSVYAASAWSAPAAFTPACTAPAGVTCFK